MKEIMIVLRVSAFILVFLFSGVVRPAVAEYQWVYLDDGDYHRVEDFTYQYNEVSLDEYKVNSPGTHLELLEGGRIGGYVIGFNNSQITISGGEVSGLWVDGHCTISVSGGTVGDAIVVKGDCQADLSGGSVEHDIEGFGEGFIDLKGSSVGDLLRVRDESLLVLHGFFSVDGQNVQNGDSLKDYGTMTTGFDWITGAVSGTLMNGTPLAVEYYISLVDPGGMPSNSDIIVQWPGLKILTPNGSESYYAGQQVMVQWTQDEYFQGVLLEYSVDSGDNWAVIDTVPAGAESYLWTVPEENSQDCLVRVRDLSEPDLYDWSNDEFTIYICTLESDTNGDCDVNLIDLAILASEWMQSGNPFEME